MTEYPKVLVGVTVYEDKDYIFDEFYANVKNLSYPNYEVLIVDNSATKKYYSKLKRRGVPVVHVNRGANSRVAHAKSLNKIRDHFLAGDYEYWMSIESDLIPPVGIIERLMKHDKDTVGCMYNIGYADNTQEPPRPCLFVTVVNEETKSISTKNLNPKEGFGLFGKGVMPIHGCGIGCSLVKRHILEKIPFQYNTDVDTVMHSDVLFYMDMHNMGLQNHVDTDIFIPHFNSKWGNVKDI